MSKWCECLKREVQSCDCPAALPPPTGDVGEYSELLDDLRAGVICTGSCETDDGEVETFDIEDAEDKIARAANALQSLSARLAEAERERDGFMRQIDEVHAAVSDHWFLDPPDGGDVKLHEGVRRIEDAYKAATAQAERLETHIRTMQGYVREYLEPGPYVDKHGEGWTFDEPHKHQTEGYAFYMRTQMQCAVLNDLIYMLDGPEERAALASAPAPEQTPEGPDLIAEAINDSLDAIAKLPPNCRATFSDEVNAAADARAAANEARDE